MNFLIIAANVLGWPVIHLVVARISLRIPLYYFRFDAASRHAFGKREARFYRDWFAVHRWKSALPDGAPWLGGFSKRRLQSRDSAYLVLFIEEARRAEFAHWLMLACLPVFFIWNPPWADAVMAAYAIAANLPCILAQRYNRAVLSGLVRRRHARASLRQSSPQSSSF